MKVEEKLQELDKRLSVVEKVLQREAEKEEDYARQLADEWKLHVF